MKLIKTTAFVIAVGFIGAGARADDKKPAAAAPAGAAAKPAAGAPAGGAAAAPAAGAPMTPPKPSPEWEAFAKGWEGSWKCETTIPAGSMGPGSPEMKAEVTAKVKKDLGGFVLVGNYDMKKTKTTPAMKGTFTLGSPDGKTLVSTNMDSMGGSTWATGALGPTGGTATGEGFMMGNKVKVRETTEKTDKAITHKAEVDMGKGFMVMYEDACKK
jgi:hypothetical protein